MKSRSSLLWAYERISQKGSNISLQNREEFRKQAILYGVANDCVIDKDTYAEISCFAGCFMSNGTWIVYNTDERSRVFNEKKYSTSWHAYTDLAERLGFKLNKITSKHYSKRPYCYGTGRSKSSVARVRIFPGGSGKITINDAT